MHSRPLTVTAAAILLVLLSLDLLPWEWFLGEVGEETPAWILYAGLVLGIVGLVAAVGLWLMKKWSFWVTIVVSVLSFLLAAPGAVMSADLPPIVTVVLAAIIIVLVVLPDTRRALTPT
ncbi:MAG: hypothetical protein LC674_06610 [Actinobacteria bacterium]|nr:hypothetical protein [Actinomycetota bacterium]